MLQQQPAGEFEGVGAMGAGAEQQRQQLGVGERGGASFKQFFTRSFARRPVAQWMGWWLMVVSCAAT